MWLKILLQKCDFSADIYFYCHLLAHYHVILKHKTWLLALWWNCNCCCVCQCWDRLFIPHSRRAVWPAMSGALLHCLAWENSAATAVRSTASKHQVFVACSASYLVHECDFWLCYSTAKISEVVQYFYTVAWELKVFGLWMSCFSVAQHHVNLQFRYSALTESLYHFVSFRHSVKMFKSAVIGINNKQTFQNTPNYRSLSSK